jgi:hypothetical protein
MQSTRAQGVLARLRGRLRGDRFMVDSQPPAPVEPAPAPAPVTAVSTAGFASEQGAQESAHAVRMHTESEPLP